MPLEELERESARAGRREEEEQGEREHVCVPERVSVPCCHPQGAVPRAPCTASLGRRPRRFPSLPVPCDAGGCQVAGGVGGRRR